MLFALNDVSVGSPIQQRLTCDGRIKMVPCHHRSIIDSAAAVARHHVHVLVDLGGCDPVEPVREAVKAYPFESVCTLWSSPQYAVACAWALWRTKALSPSPRRAESTNGFRLSADRLRVPFRPIPSHSIPFQCAVSLRSAVPCFAFPLPQSQARSIRAATHKAHGPKCSRCVLRRSRWVPTIR